MRQQLDRLLSTLEHHTSPVAIVILGIGIAFGTGLVPHRAHAFELLPLQVAAGVMPYMIFGMLAWMLQEPVVIRYGLAVLALHLLAALTQRGILGTDGGNAPLLIGVPLFLTAALLTLWPQALEASAPRAPNSSRDDTSTPDSKPASAYPSPESSPEPRP